jgi:PAS domain S-box-containing protein
VLDPVGRIVLANKAMQIVLGVDLEGLLGQLLRDKGVSSTDRDTIQRMVEAQAPLREEVRLARGDGRSVLLSLASSAFGSESVRGIICACRDVSEERDIERFLADAAARDAKSLGNSLHEGLAQTLSGISFFVAGLGRATRATERARDVEVVNEYIADAIHTARTLAQRISPTTPSRGSLHEALRLLAEVSTEQSGVRVEYAGGAPQEVEDSQLGDQLCRLASDAIALSANDVNAASIAFDMREGPDAWTFNIRVEGRSPAASPDSIRHLTQVVAYRARLLGGSCVPKAEGAAAYLFAVTIPKALVGGAAG